MNQFKTVLSKELRSYFLQPVALVFLGIFLVVNLFVFFTQSTFFARNIADVRPMFEWMPILLIVLVSAVSMRAWSEEQSSGTIEVLMTLPMNTWVMVLGKLAAGLVLVATALALTLPLPIMVATMGDIDVGPVIGGYVGALFLATAYLSIGMCVSAKTDNQIVALMVTAIIGALFYLVGSDTLTGFFSADTGAVLRAIGTGSRFYNIERGVLDVRDIAYYLSLAAFFVVLNVHFIESKRADVHSGAGRRRQRSRLTAITLTALNAVVLNLWLAPVGSARADLTENGQFSLSDASEKILSNLTEPLIITGYFSDNTHPLLAPLVPTIRDFLVEYKNAGHGKVTVRFQNPNEDEKLEQEVAQSYNIKPYPFRVAARHQESVVNAYFHILVKYGDEYDVLSVDDLIEVERHGDDIEVRLKNLEYDVTRTIKKVTSGFQSIEAVFAKMATKPVLTFYVTPNTLPEDLKQVPEFVQKVADELQKKSNGKMQFRKVDLTNDRAKQEEIAKKYGIRPMAADLFGEQVFYAHLVLENGDKTQQILIQGTPTEAAIRTAIEGAFKRSTPGFLKTIGLLTAKPEDTRNPNMPPQMQQPPRPDFQVLERHLGQEFQVRRVNLEDGVVPGDIDVLLIAKPGTLTEKQLFAIDQFLMNKGAVIVFAGDKQIKANQQGITAESEGDEIAELLRTYGIAIQDGFVLDAQNAAFPIPINERKGMFVIRKIKMMDYPFFPDIRDDGFNAKHVATSGLEQLVYNWGSALEIKKVEGVTYEELLHTSPHAWIRTDTKILPDSVDSASVEFAPPDTTKRYLVAVAAEGSFPSYFADKPSPLFTAGNQNKSKDTADDTASETKDSDTDSAADTDQAKKKEDRTGRTIKKGYGGKLAVVGSGEMLSDLTASVGDQITGNVYASNFQFARNLIDWATADTDLIGIRTAGTFARTLKPLEESERTAWEVGQYLFALLALCIVALTAHLRRRNVVSILETEGGK